MKRWNVLIQVSATQLVGYNVTVAAETRNDAEAAARATIRRYTDLQPSVVEPVRKQVLTAQAVEQPEQEVLGD